MENKDERNRPNADAEAALFGSRFIPRWLREKRTLQLILLLLVALIWLPRLQGPIDLRWDGGVYYILGTSLAEGKGYRLLNEPGEIDAVQYPPVLPAIIAGFQLVLGTSDPTTVGTWLRISAFFVFCLFILTVFRFFTDRVSLFWSFLGTVLCIFSLHVYFLSDLCYPEIPFALLTLLFISCLRRESRASYFILAYVLATASYGLRTVGLAAFAAWILSSLVKKEFKRAALKTLLVLIPIFAWQYYIATIESSDGYNQPAYAYQRAPYMFYNVTYARNMALHDPFAPEQGPARNLQRTFQNVVKAPANLGETISTVRGYWLIFFQSLTGSDESDGFPAWFVFIVLYMIGLAVLAGLLLQLRGGDWIVPLYLLPYLAAMCFTPFPEQYPRYLMPVTPLLSFCFISFLIFIKDRFSATDPAKRSNIIRIAFALVFVSFFSIQFFCLQHVFRNDFETAAYLDRQNRFVRRRLFFNNDLQIDFDLCVDFIKENAAGQAIVGAGTPHWVYLRTGLKAVMPPMEKDANRAQELLDSVPVRYLIIGQDVVKSERYMLPVVQRFPDRWKQVYSTPSKVFVVYERTDQY
ncbi:MAG TPA: hypothetical protein VIL74_04990 [Pyrinomonadaceae bacterium]|jgi:hypothetical protein